MRARRLAWALLDGGVLATVLGLSKVHAAVVADPAYDYSSSSRLSWSLAYAALLCLTAYGVGLPDLPRTRPWAVAASATSAGGAAAGISIAQLVAGNALLPRYVIMGALVILVPWQVLCARVAQHGRARAEERDRVLVIGDHHDAELLRIELSQSPERAATVVGALGVEDARETGSQSPMEAAVAATGANVVVLDRRAQADETVVAQAGALHARGIRVRTLTLLYEQWLGKLPVAELERVSLMFDIGELHRARYGRVKRLLDVTLALAGAVVLLVCLPVVVLGDLAGNRGPLLYRQIRIGKRRQPCSIVKFRTMAPVDGVATNDWTVEDDPRITPFGRFLRRSHLDELPQVWNVLRGDLSIVGPRPEQPRYVTELCDKLPFYDLRHLVRPGLTGWAQVKQGYAGTEGDALEKLQYEFFYLRHQSLTLDLRVLARTFRHVIAGAGR